MISISFFSYKGGAGRTTLAYNTVPYLIKELKPTPQNPIIIVDLDIDSKGMSFLLDRASAVNTIQVLKNEIEVDYCDPEAIPIVKHPFFKSLAAVGTEFGTDEKDDASVLFVSAKATNTDNYYINNTNNFDAAGIGLSGLVELCERYGCKALIMDTPAGEQLASDAALNISDTIITVMRITKQFRQGTFTFLKARSSRYEGKRFIVVPNAVPHIAGVNAKIIDNIFASINASLSSIPDKNTIDIDFANNAFSGINEVQLFKINEASLFLEKRNRTLTEDEEAASEKYIELARKILNDE